MRRTDDEFKAEVYRRSEAWRVRRVKRGKMIAAVCLPVVLCSSAWLLLIDGASGGATERNGIAADSAFCEEGQQAPAAAAPESAEEFASPADSPEEPAAGAQDNSGSTVCNAVIESITVTSQPEMEAYARVFTVPEKTGAIMDAVQAFFDAPDTVIGSDDLGFCEGMAYRIVVREETNTREYLLFNEALNADGLWYVNPECCRDLERLLLQEGD